MQEFVVSAIVLFAAMAVTRRYLPKAIKRRMREGTVRALRLFGWEGAAAWLEREAEAAASCADGCGSCGGCGTKDAGVSQTEFAITPESMKRIHRH